MFGIPERQTRDGIVSFYVPLTNPQRLNACLTCLDSSTIRPDVKFQDKFKLLQDAVLKELIQNRQLFRTPPSMESLEAITPNWGVVYNNDTYAWSPYTYITQESLSKMKLPAYIDLVLNGVHISRSSILPQFTCLYLEPMSEEVIDFDWERPQAEIEEVSDVPASDGEIVVLKDATAQAAERLAAKQSVREAYTNARAAYSKADQLAHEFLDKYDLSDNESAFSGMDDMSEDESTT